MADNRFDDILLGTSTEDETKQDSARFDTTLLGDTPQVEQGQSLAQDLGIPTKGIKSVISGVLGGIESAPETIVEGIKESPFEIGLSGVTALATPKKFGAGLIPVIGDKLDALEAGAAGIGKSLDDFFIKDVPLRDIGFSSNMAQAFAEQKAGNYLMKKLGLFSNKTILGKFGKSKSEVLKEAEEALASGNRLKMDEFENTLRDVEREFHGGKEVFTAVERGTMQEPVGSREAIQSIVSGEASLKAFGSRNELVANVQRIKKIRQDYNKKIAKGIKSTVGDALEVFDAVGKTARSDYNMMLGQLSDSVATSATKAGNNPIDIQDLLTTLDSSTGRQLSSQISVDKLKRVVRGALSESPLNREGTKILAGRTPLTKLTAKEFDDLSLKIFHELGTDPASKRAVINDIMPLLQDSLQTSSINQKGLQEFASAWGENFTERGIILSKLDSKAFNILEDISKGDAEAFKEIFKDKNLFDEFVEVLPEGDIFTKGILPDSFQDLMKREMIDPTTNDLTFKAVNNTLNKFDPNIIREMVGEKGLEGYRLLRLGLRALEDVPQLSKMGQGLSRAEQGTIQDVTEEAMSNLVLALPKRSAIRAFLTNKRVRMFPNANKNDLNEAMLSRVGLEFIAHPVDDFGSYRLYQTLAREIGVEPITYDIFQDTMKENNK